MAIASLFPWRRARESPSSNASTSTLSDSHTRIRSPSRMLPASLSITSPKRSSASASSAGNVSLSTTIESSPPLQAGVRSYSDPLSPGRKEPLPSLTSSPAAATASLGLSPLSASKYPKRNTTLEARASSLHRARSWRGVPLRTTNPMSRSRSRRESMKPIANEFAPTSSVSPTALYGYTPMAFDVELTVPQVRALVDVASEAILLHGLQTPLLFSSLALGLTSTGPASLIRSYLSGGSSPAPGQPVPAAFLAESKFAQPSDLAAVVKWALGRIVTHIRMSTPNSGDNYNKGYSSESHQAVRGLVSIDTYQAWRHEERADGYPLSSYTEFEDRVSMEVAGLLQSLFSLLSTVAAHAIQNGMTPARLARHFGPLLFGLPEDDTFENTYLAFVRATNATEHLLLAYIRNMGTRLMAKGASLPTRLSQATAGYPNMLSTDLDILPTASTKTVPVTMIERSVKSYASNLLEEALVFDMPTKCKEWDACHCMDARDAQHGALPQFTHSYRKLINYRGGVQTAPSPTAKYGVAGQNSPVPGVDPTNHVGPNSSTATHASLADKVWTDFVYAGFEESDSSRLNFDLQEGARKQWESRKSQADSNPKLWGEFAASGFEAAQGDPLNSALAFNPELAVPVTEVGSDHKLIEKELAKKRKALLTEPAFPYDSKARVMASPTMSSVARTTTKSASTGSSCSRGPEPYMDELFAEVWADYILCGGWSRFPLTTPSSASLSPITGSSSVPTSPAEMEEDAAIRAMLNRRRPASWVVVQYKSRPTKWSVSATLASGAGDTSTSSAPPLWAMATSDSTDPRTDAAWFVVSEVVPEAYRTAMEAHDSRKLQGGKVSRFNVFRRKPSRYFDPSPSDGPKTFSLASRRASSDTKRMFSPGSTWGGSSFSGPGRVSAGLGRKTSQLAIDDDDDDPDDPFRPGSRIPTKHITLAPVKHDWDNEDSTTLAAEDEVEVLAHLDTAPSSSQCEIAHETPRPHTSNGQYRF